MNRTASSFLYLGSFVAFAALAIVSGCAHQNTQPLITPVAISPPEQIGYVGAEKCAPCHAAEFDIQSKTHHALTLRHATRKELGPLSPPIGRVGDAPYVVAEEKGEFVFASADEAAGAAPFQYAFGSGIANITFIGQIDANRITEFRMSYNPGEKRWYTTPGQETSEDLSIGRAHAAGIARRCIHCHSGARAADRLAPQEGLLGVQCESCHGPGAAHIEAASLNSRPKDLKILNPGHMSAHGVNEVCGDCHRTTRDIPLQGLDTVNTGRFQPYAIENSPCYRKSGDAISCITCHDAHKDASTDLKHYEAICLSCHSSKAGPPAKACPVNATEKCIGCHMPQRRVLPGTHIPLTMTDHLIWAYRPEKGSGGSHKTAAR